MTPSVHGGVNHLVYLNRGMVLKKFMMSEKESGPVAVELPGSVMVWTGMERGSRRFALVPMKDSLKRAVRTRLKSSDGLKFNRRTDSLRFNDFTRSDVDEIHFHRIKLHIDKVFWGCMEMISLQALPPAFKDRGSH